MMQSKPMVEVHPNGPYFFHMILLCYLVVSFLFPDKSDKLPTLFIPGFNND